MRSTWLGALATARHERQLARRTFLGGTAALATLPLAAACGASRPVSDPFSNGGVWQNVSGTLTVLPEMLAYPASAAALVIVVQAAERTGRRVRMTGSGHSYSDVAASDDFLLLPDRLSKTLNLDRSRLVESAQADKHLVRVASGSTIRFLNAELAKQALAFEVLGGYNAQTIAGATMTGTHGSGLSHGPLADQIVSIQLVTSGGELIQIEPTHGISDPRRYPAPLEEDPRLSLRLLQDDRIFDAVRISMGCMGIVYAYALRAVDAFWIREKRTLVRWSTLSAPGGYLRGYLENPRDPRYPDDVQVSICPYPLPLTRGERHCLLTQRWRIADKPVETPETRTRGLLGSGHLLADPNLRGTAERLLVDWLDHATSDDLARIHDAFMAVLVDPNYTAPSYDVFNLGDINRFRVWGIELGFPLRDTVLAVEHLFELAEEQRRLGRHHSVPVSLRFVKASTAPLSMQYGQDTTMMEIGMLVAARDSKALLEAYERRFIDEFSARPHWGLDLSVLKSFAEVQKLFPAAGDWLQVYESLNRTGVFNGRFTDRLGISRPQSTMLSQR